MRIIIGLITCLLLSSVSIAGVITPYKTYATNDQVTAANFNGNITTITGEINGGLDNTNADTTNGYRFFEVLGSIPAAGTQGRVVFLTTENTINFDTGAAWNSAVSVTTPTQGDILYYNGTAWAKLAAGTANYALVTNGAAANPAFETELGWTKMAWANFIDGTISDSYNVTSITAGAGDDTVNFTVAFANANYCAVATSGINTSGYSRTGTPLAGSIHVLSYNDQGAQLNGQNSLLCIGD